MIEITDWRTRRRRKSLIPYLEMTEEEKEQAMTELMSFAELKIKLEIEHAPYIYILQSEKKMPAWLVDGKWKFHPDEIDLWLEEMGGDAGVKGHIEDWERRKREHEESQKSGTREPKENDE